MGCAVREHARQCAETAPDFQHVGILGHVVPAEKGLTHIGEMKEYIPSTVCRKHIVINSVRMKRDVMIDVLLDLGDRGRCLDKFFMQLCHGGSFFRDGQALPEIIL